MFIQLKQTTLSGGSGEPNSIISNMKRFFVFVVALVGFASVAMANVATGEGVSLVQNSTELVDEALLEEVTTHIADFADFIAIIDGNTINSSKINQWVALNKKYFTNRQLRALRDRLAQIDEEAFQMLIAQDYKDPSTALILSIFLGSLGVDRFYIGDIGLGVVKLITAGGFGVWTIIDWFLISGATRGNNYEELMDYLMFVGN